MAILPAFTVLPDSQLTPYQVADKFAPQSLAGMGLVARRAMSGMSGMGDTMISCMAFDEEGNCTDYTTEGGSPQVSGGDGSSPSGTSSVNWTPVIGATTQGLLDIAKLNSIQPGTVQQGGMTMRQNPGYPVGVGASLTTPSSSSLLVMAVAAVAALFLLKGGR